MLILTLTNFNKDNQTMIESKTENILLTLLVVLTFALGYYTLNKTSAQPKKDLLFMSTDNFNYLYFLTMFYLYAQIQ